MSLGSGQVKLLSLKALFGEGVWSGDELQKEDWKEKHHHLSVAASNISALKPNMDEEVGVHKNEKQTANESEWTLAEALSSILRDKDELFLLSLLPSMKRLTNKKRMEERMRF